MSEQVVLWTVTLIKLTEINTNFQCNFDNFYQNILFQDFVLTKYFYFGELDDDYLVISEIPEDMRCQLSHALLGNC